MFRAPAEGCRRTPRLREQIRDGNAHRRYADTLERGVQAELETLPEAAILGFAIEEYRGDFDIFSMTIPRISSVRR